MYDNVKSSIASPNCICNTQCLAIGENACLGQPHQKYNSVPTPCVPGTDECNRLPSPKESNRGKDQGEKQCLSSGCECETAEHREEALDSGI